MDIIRTRHSRHLDQGRALTPVAFPSYFWLTGPGPRPLSPDSPIGQPARGQTDGNSGHKQGDNWVLLPYGETLGSPLPSLSLSSPTIKGEKGLGDLWGPCSSDLANSDSGSWPNPRLTPKAFCLPTAAIWWPSRVNCTWL